MFWDFSVSFQTVWSRFPNPLGFFSEFEKHDSDSLRTFLGGEARKEKRFFSWVWSIKLSSLPLKKRWYMRHWWIWIAIEEADLKYARFAKWRFIIRRINSLTIRLFNLEAIQLAITSFREKFGTAWLMRIVSDGTCFLNDYSRLIDYLSKSPHSMRFI